MKIAFSKKKLAVSSAIILAAVVLIAAVFVIRGTKDMPKDTQPASVGQFMDCFEPMPIVGELTTDCWGSVVGARDQSNGLEDRSNNYFCYWDGKILKDKKTGTY